MPKGGPMNEMWRSMTIAAAACALALPTPAQKQGAHLDDAAKRNRRDAPGDRDRLIEGLAFDEVVAADLLLGFGERAVGDGRLAVSGAHGGSARSRLQPRAGHVPTAPVEALDELAIAPHDAVALRRGQRV